MAGTFPSTPGCSNVDLESQYPTVDDFAESGKRYARNEGGHLWRLDLKFPIMTRAQMMPIYAFAMKQKGTFESFQFVAPGYSTPSGDAFPLLPNYVLWSEEMQQSGTWIPTNIGAITTNTTGTLDTVPTSAAGGYLAQLVSFIGSTPGDSVLAFDVVKGTSAQTKVDIVGMALPPSVTLDWGAGAAPTLNSSTNIDSVDISLVSGSTYRVTCNLTGQYGTGSYSLIFYPANAGTGNVEVGRWQATQGSVHTYRTTATSTGEISVDGVHAAGVTSIAVEGLPTSVSYAIRAGDIFKISSHSKVYMVTGNRSSDSSGKIASLIFEPPLIEALVGGESLTFDDCPFTVAFESPIQEMKTSQPKLFRYEVSLVESL